jgi:hypothetical protein
MPDDDWAEQVSRQIQRHIHEDFPTGVNVPTGVTEDAAVLAVQRQFQESGFSAEPVLARTR